MNAHFFKIAFIIGVVALQAGCATSPVAPTNAPKNAVQGSAGTTVGGYIDVGGREKF